MRGVLLLRLLATACPALLAHALLPSEALSYCLSTTCKGVDACDGEEIPGCPTLKWTSGCVGFSVHELGGSGLSADSVNQIADLAFDAWRSVDCGNGPPGIVIQDLGQVSCGLVEYNKSAGNANIVVFNGEWAHSDTGHTFALTTTTFDPETGELYNADIELNARDHLFTANDDQVVADLLSVLTHETGHFLGIAHAQEPEATMFPFYEEGSTELRSLEADDFAAVCAAYPPTPSLDDTCNPLPKHGFSPHCRDDQPEGSCSLRPGRENGLASLWISALGLSLVLRRRHVPQAR